MIKELVQNLGKNKKAGSSVNIGYSYQDIPGYNIPFHRGNSEARVKYIYDHLNIRNKTILDLGCNVGTISNLFLEYGARSVTGIDYDENSIKLGKLIYRNIDLKLKDVTIEYIKNLGHYDIIVWLSQFMWMAKQHSLEYAWDFLFELGKHCDTLVFETAGKEDGSAPIPYKQQEIHSLLCQNSSFQSIIDIGPWIYEIKDEDWSLRNIFILNDPLDYSEGEDSEILINKRGKIVKSYAKSKRDIEKNYAKYLQEREIGFLKELSEYPYFPNILNEEKDSFTMTYEGPKAIWIPEDDIKNILAILKKHTITHRDIRPDNLLWNGNNVVLIDFAWAIKDGEETAYTGRLGGKYKCPYGFNDEYSFRKTQFNLMRSK